MTLAQQWIAYVTMIRKEWIRFMRLWIQTLLPSVVTTVLYFVIFGTFIGSQIHPVDGFTYIQFIVPGLVMMAVITNAFANVVSSFFGAKFQRQLEEILVSPLTPLTVIAAFVTGGVLRGLTVGVLVLVVSMFFAHLAVHSFAVMFLFILLTAVLFSLAGLINGIYATDFDGISIVPTFVLTPLTYLGGVFYSVRMLPPLWQNVSRFNPILYMVDGFRYGLLGVSDMDIRVSISVLLGFIVVLLWVTVHLFNTGRGLRS